MSQRRGAAGGTDFAAFDALGSTAQLTNSGQAVTDSYLLDAWGNPISTTGSTTNPHRFVGELGYYFVPALGLYYIRDRWYDKATGKWISQDREGFSAGDANLSRYVGNFPVNGVDPSGAQQVPPQGPKPDIRAGWEATQVTAPINSPLIGRFIVQCVDGKNYLVVLPANVSDIDTNIQPPGFRFGPPDENWPRENWPPENRSPLMRRFLDLSFAEFMDQDRFPLRPIDISALKPIFNTDFDLAYTRNAAPGVGLIPPVLLHDKAGRKLAELDVNGIATGVVKMAAKNAWNANKDQIASGVTQIAQERLGLGIKVPAEGIELKNPTTISVGKIYLRPLSASSRGKVIATVEIQVIFDK